MFKETVELLLGSSEKLGIVLEETEKESGGSMTHAVSGALGDFVAAVAQASYDLGQDGMNDELENLIEDVRTVRVEGKVEEAVFF